MSYKGKPESEGTPLGVVKGGEGRMVYPWVAPGYGDKGERIRHDVATETKESREPGRLLNGGGETVDANASVGVPCA